MTLSQPEFLQVALDWSSEAIDHLPDDLAIIAQRAEALTLSGQLCSARSLWERACTTTRPARTLAAWILCAVADAAAVPPTHTPAEEMAVSRSFIEWYRKLLSAGRRETLMCLNSRVDAFRASLPTAAGWLDSALAEAAAPST